MAKKVNVVDAQLVSTNGGHKYVYTLACGHVHERQASFGVRKSIRCNKCAFNMPKEVPSN